MKPRSFLRLSISIFTVLALSLLFAEFGGFPFEKPNVSAQNNEKYSSKDTLRERSHQTFKKGRQMLLDHGVNFEPNDLLDYRKKDRVISRLESRSEFRKSEMTSNRLSGVRIADTLYLPEKIQLDGDTVIIARFLIFEGENAEIRGHHDLHIFPLEEIGMLGTSLKNAYHRKNPGMVSVSDTELGNFNFSKVRLPIIAGGNLIVDLRGFGHEEWLEREKKRSKINNHTGNAMFRSIKYEEVASVFEFAQTQGSDGGIGTTGGDGTQGTTGTTGGSGTTGVCSGGSINGGAGDPPGSAGNGTQPNAGGGTGNTGGDGSYHSFVIPTFNHQMSYEFWTNGGRGGQGGTGGTGGMGGTGGIGGLGGPGASCSCAIGQGSGGPGGPGGTGGTGGKGGTGGQGGIGGRGGDLFVTKPNGYSGTITAHTERGLPGPAGTGGTGGQVGSFEYGRGGGTAGSNISCSPIGGTSGAKGSDGGFGALGAGGDVGSIGTSGPSDGVPTIFERDPCEPILDCLPPGFNAETCSCGESPIVIDVLGNGFDLSSASNGVVFDISCIGIPKQIAWTSPGSDDGWLVLDRNGNGLIDDGKEMFGNFTEQPKPQTGQQKNGFLAMALFDKTENGGNGDGLISSKDEVYGRLRIWQDVNHNGVSESNELHTLSDLGVRSLELDYRESKRTDQHGNQFRYRAKVFGDRGSAVGRWAWDVFLGSQ
jgi:hypothetical protein